MKTIAVLKYILLPVVVMMTLSVSGQARVVLNGAHIVIAKNATLVLENHAPNAITRYDGSIISEGEGNKVLWMIGETIGTYTLPWGDGNTHLPLTFTKTAGTGAGNFLFSTYPTQPQNSLNLPSGVSDLNIGGTDKSYFFIDRFWQLNAQGYSSKPSLTNVQFGYIDAEHDLPNTIVEASLGAQRWNDDTNTWDGFAPAGIADINSNQVSVAGIANTDLYKWWSLVGEEKILPVRFLSFTAEWQGNTVKLFWNTADEVDIMEFAVQRSVNGNSFITIGGTPAQGGMGPHVYSYTDSLPIQGRNYYRIKEKNTNGTVHYSATRSVLMSNNARVEVYPNPVTGHKFTINATGIPAGSYSIQLFGLEGKLVASFFRFLNGNFEIVELNKPLTRGLYLLKITSKNDQFTTHLLIDKN